MKKQPLRVGIIFIVVVILILLGFMRYLRNFMYRLTILEERGLGMLIEFLSLVVVGLATTGLGR